MNKIAVAMVCLLADLSQVQTNGEPPSEEAAVIDSGVQSSSYPLGRYGSTGFIIIFQIPLYMDKPDVEPSPDLGLSSSKVASE